MLDPFSRRPTFLCGSTLPKVAEQRALIEHHQQRLEAIARLRQAAAECGLATDPESHLLVLPEDDLSVLEFEGGVWARLCLSIRRLRKLLPIVSLAAFGFQPEADDPLDNNRGDLRRIGLGMEAWVFQDQLGSVYKFFLPRLVRWTGATFCFSQAAEESLIATATLESSYTDLLQKLLLLNAIHGMPTEITAITPEGILVAKQTRGQPLPPGTDPSPWLESPPLSVCPSRYLSCDRAHPRLVFMDGRPWLIGDLHERNLAHDENGKLRIIDLVAAPIPAHFVSRYAWMRSPGHPEDNIRNEDL